MARAGHRPAGDRRRPRRLSPGGPRPRDRPRVDGAPGRPGSLRRPTVRPQLQVRRLPVQRVLHEVVRRARGPLAPAPPLRGREGGPAARRRHVHPGARLAQGVRPRRRRQERRPRPRPGTVAPDPAACRHLAGRTPPRRAGPPRPQLPPPRPQGRYCRPFLHPRQGVQLAARLDAGPEPQPRPCLHRRPARLPERPDLPARRPGRGLPGWCPRSGAAAGGRPHDGRASPGRIPGATTAHRLDPRPARGRRRADGARDGRS